MRVRKRAYLPFDKHGDFDPDERAGNGADCIRKEKKKGHLGKNKLTKREKPDAIRKDGGGEMIDERRAIARARDYGERDVLEKGEEEDCRD